MHRHAGAPRPYAQRHRGAIERSAGLTNEPRGRAGRTRRNGHPAEPEIGEGSSVALSSKAGTLLTTRADVPAVAALGKGSLAVRLTGPPRESVGLAGRCLRRDGGADLDGGMF